MSLFHNMNWQKTNDRCLRVNDHYFANKKMESIVRFCESLRHIMMAVSWGGHESLVIPKCAGVNPGDFDPANKEHRYVRLYVGLEEPAYLVNDLEQAFAAMEN